MAFVLLSPGAAVKTRAGRAGLGRSGASTGVRSRVGTFMRMPKERQNSSEQERRIREVFGNGVVTEREEPQKRDRAAGEYYVKELGSQPQTQRDKAQRRDAIVTLASILLLSVVAGVIFTYLWNTGSVHDGTLRRQKMYNMPTYGTESYIEPLQLLTRDLLEERRAAEAAARAASSAAADGSPVVSASGAQSTNTQ